MESHEPKWTISCMRMGWGVTHSWRGCLKMGGFKKKMKVCWCLPPFGVLKFNVDGAAKGKPGLAGIWGVLRNHKGEVIYMFPSMLGSKTLMKKRFWPYWTLFAFIIP